MFSHCGMNKESINELQSAVLTCLAYQYAAMLNVSVARFFLFRITKEI